MTVLGWKNEYGEDLNVERLRDIFSPPDRYRVSEFMYPAATVTSGAMLGGKCFAFSGSVTFEYGDNRIQIDAGNCAQLPMGSYLLRTEDKGDTKIVIVWEIPTE
jgi:hypothetical protein